LHTDYFVTEGLVVGLRASSAGGRSLADLFGGALGTNPNTAT